ncbi:hypothetical protein ABK040_013219 [Willaertia magna]
MSEDRYGNIGSDEEYDMSLGNPYDDNDPYAEEELTMKTTTVGGNRDPPPEEQQYEENEMENTYNNERTIMNNYNIDNQEFEVHQAESKVTSNNLSDEERHYSSTSTHFGNRPSSAKAKVPSTSPSIQNRPQTSSSYSRNKLSIPKYKLPNIPPPYNFPITSSRSTNSVLERNSLSKKQIVQNYLSNVNKQMKKRTIPTSFYKDPEGMYMDLQDLKNEITVLKKENQALKTQIHKIEGDKIRKQKQVEELLRAHALVETKGAHYENLFKEVNLVKGLKARIRDLEKTLLEKENEFQRIKLDSRYTRVRELETELKAYYTESRRLQKLVEQFQERQKYFDKLEDDTLKLTQQNTKLRELIVKMKHVQDYYKEQHQAISQMENIDNDKNAKLVEYEEKIKSLEINLQEAMNENQSLRTSLEETNTTISELHQENQQQQQLLQILNEEKQKLAQKIEKNNQNVVSLQNEVEVHKTMVKEKADIAESKSKEILRLHQTLEEREKERQIFISKIAELEKISQQHKQEIDIIKSQNHSLEQDKLKLVEELNNKTLVIVEESKEITVEKTKEKSETVAEETISNENKYGFEESETTESIYDKAATVVQRGVRDYLRRKHNTEQKTLNAVEVKEQTVTAPKEPAAERVVDTQPAYDEFGGSMDEEKDVSQNNLFDEHNENFLGDEDEGIAFEDTNEGFDYDEEW